MVSASNIYEEYSIEELAKSKIPNLVFVYQFLNIKDLEIDMKYWEKCADVLIFRGHEKIKDIEFLMLIWLQDLNWSDSIKIFNYFLSLDINELKDLIIDAFDLAYHQDDVEWAINLWNLLLNKKDGYIIEKNLKENVYLSQFIEKVLKENK